MIVSVREMVGHLVGHGDEHCHWIDSNFANALAAIVTAFLLGQSGQSQSHPYPTRTL